MNWKTAWAELWYGQLSATIDQMRRNEASLEQQLQQWRDRYDIQRARADLVAAMNEESETARRAASNALNQKILSDMQRNPERYVASSD